MKLKKINKVLLLFFASLVMCFYLFVQTIQSNWFVSILSNSVDGYFKKYVSKELTFSTVELQLFPPGIEIGNISSRVKNKDIDATIHAAKLGVYFNIIDFFSRKLSVKEIAIKDSIININKIKEFQNSQNNLKPTDVNSKEVFEDIQKVLRELPVKLYSLSLYNSQINYGKKYSIDINRLISKMSEKNIIFSTDIDIEGEFKKYINNFNGNIIIYPNKMDVYNLKITQNSESITLSGEVRDYLNKEKIKYNMNANGQIFLPHLHNFLDFKKIGEIKNGWLAINSLHVKGTMKEIQGSGKLLIRNLKSRYANAESLAVNFHMKDDEVIVNKFNLTDKGGSVTLLKNAVFYSFKKNQFMTTDIDVLTQNFDLNNALKYIQAQLYPLSGKLNGPVKFQFSKPNFKFITTDATTISNLKLQFGEAKILEIQKAKLLNSQFIIKDYHFSMNSTLIFNGNRIPVVGEVKDDGVYFSALDSVLKIEELGKIVGLDIKGDAELDIIVGGKFGDTKLFINGDIGSTVFEKINLGDIELNKIIHLNKNFIEFKKMRGIIKEEEYFVNGLIHYDEFKLDLKGKIPNITYYNLYSMFKDFLPNVDLYQDHILGPLVINFNIKNKKKSFYIEGEIIGNNLFFINESITKVNANFYIDPNDIKIFDIDLKKGHGNVKGSVDISLAKGQKILDFKLEKIHLNDFNIYKSLPLRLTGLLSGKVKIDYTDKLNSLDLRIDLANSKVLSTPVKDSFIKAFYKNKKLSVKSQVMEDIKIESKINFNNKKKSFAFVDLNISDVSKFLIAYAGLDSNASQVRGRLVGDINTSFYYDRLENLDLSASLSEFYLKKDEVYINLDIAKTIIVKNGIIKDWDIEIKGDNAFVVSKAKGNFSKQYDVFIQADYSASLIEILSNKVVEAKGKITNKFELNDSGHEFITGSKDLYLDIEGLPTYITDANYKFILKDYKFIVENFTAKLKEGVIRFRGDFIPKFPYPEVNFTFEMEKAKFYIFKNSNVIVSASGTLYGTKAPYKINASVVQEGGEIFDELNDMAGEDLSSSLIRNKFLPKVNRSSGAGLFDINASLISNAPVWIKNSSVDLKLIGNLEVKGSIETPKVLGEYKILPIVSKINMKNNNFKVKKGSIVFDGISDYKDPKLNILSESSLDKYKVRLHAFGKVSDLSLDLTSDPYLNTQDILSLIALGYTDKVSQQLNDGQQQSLSSIGIGAILFDQLKFNDSLKKNFGLSVNLGTEVQEDINSSLIDAKGGSSGDTGRFRSATKIEVKKKLNDVMDIAVSSTVGGDIGQNQKMNLNLNVKKNVSLEMIYENRTNLEDDRATDADSFGLDVRFKKDFK